MLQPTVTTSPFTASHTGIISPTSSSDVGDKSKTSASHVEDQQPAIASHVGGTTLVIASHTTHTSPNFSSHVGDSSPNSVSHVGDSSPTFASHIGDILLASTSHAGSMSPTNVIHVGGIRTIQKPRRIRSKPKFLCRLCKGYYLICLFPTTMVVQEAWSFPRGPLGSELSLVFQHSSPSLVDTTVMPMQSSVDTTPIFGGDGSLDLVL
jgi:hypothetical protein